MIKLLVFDFDGTLVDTKNIVYKLVFNSIRKFNYEISKTLIQQQLGNKPLQELLTFLGVTSQDAKKIIRDSNLGQIKNSSKVRPSKGLKNLAKLKKRKIILSNNFSPFITEVLKNLNITFFDEIYGADDFKKNKEFHLRKLIRKYNLKPKEVIYIGDKKRDVDVARTVSCVSVIISNKYSWGNKKEILEAKPDFIISDLSQLKQIVNRLD